MAAGNSATLHVCVTCKGMAPAEGNCPLPGAQLAQALSADPPPGVTVRAVACLSACTQGCSIALSGPGKWSYVYGRLSPADAAAILQGAALYAQSADGIVPWRARPEIFRKQSLARIPPMEAP